MPQRLPLPRVFRNEVAASSKMKNVWWHIKSTKLFTWFRRSDYNPYHRNILQIERETAKTAMKNNLLKNKVLTAKTYDEAFQLARQKKQVQFVFDGVRYYAERDCPVNQEYQEDGIVLRGRGDVADRIPRDKEGNLDLLAEAPIVVSIIPIEGPSRVGHVCMQYQDRVINRLATSVHTDPLFPKYGKFSEYYFVYPSAVGIEPKRLLREMDKHNIKYGDKKYRLISNNCASNVATVLKKVGVKDFDFFGPDKLGIVLSTPGNNPFNVGIKNWCFKHGVHVHTNEMEQLDKLYPIYNVKERREEMKAIRARYRNISQKQRKYSLLRLIKKYSI